MEHQPSSVFTFVPALVEGKGHGEEQAYQIHQMPDISPVEGQLQLFAAPKVGLFGHYTGCGEIRLK